MQYMELFTILMITMALCHLIVLEEAPVMKFAWYSTIGPMAIIVFASIKDARIIFMLAFGLALACLVTGMNSSRLKIAVKR